MKIPRVFLSIAALALLAGFVIAPGLIVSWPALHPDKKPGAARVHVWPDDGTMLYISMYDGSEAPTCPASTAMGEACACLFDAKTKKVMVYYAPHCSRVSALAPVRNGP